MPKDEGDNRKGKRNHGNKVGEGGGKQKTKGGGFQCSHSNGEMIQVQSREKARNRSGQEWAMVMGWGITHREQRKEKQEQWGFLVVPVLRGISS